VGVLGDLLLSLVGVAVVIAAPLEIAFATLVAFWLLVPGNLIVPHAPHILLVHRAVLYAFVVRFVLRRGEGEPNRNAFSFTAVHLALAVLLLVGFFDGVVLPSDSVPLSGDLHSWLSLLDLFILFVVVLAVIRTITPRRSVNVIVPVLGAAIAIGILERFFFHNGWSHFFFEHLPLTDLAPGTTVLQTRGGHVRAQVAGQFALEYGWVLAALLPLTIFAVMRWARGKWWTRLALALPLLLVLAVVFSGSRVPQLAAVVAVIVLVLAAGADRRMLPWAAAAVGAALVAAISDPSLISSPFSDTSSTDPSSIRLDRLPPLLSLVVHHPFTGLGFQGIASVFGGLDDAYALVYSTLGAIGVLAWVVLMVTAIAACARALRAPRGSSQRTLGAACLVGIIVIMIAAANYDLVDTSQSTWTLIFLAAIGTAVAETVPRRVPAPRRWLPRLLLPATGVGIGFLVLAAAPVTASETLSIFTVAPWVVATEGPVYPGNGAELVNTLCPTLTNPDVLEPGATVKCLLGANIFPTDYAGLALVTVRAPTPSAVRSEVKRAFTPIFRYMPIEGGPSEPIQTGKPSWATTAPLSGGVAGLMAMLLLPAVALPRRRALNARGRSHGPIEVDELAMTGAGA